MEVKKQTNYVIPKDYKYKYYLKSDVTKKILQQEVHHRVKDDKAVYETVTTSINNKRHKSQMANLPLGILYYAYQQVVDNASEVIEVTEIYALSEDHYNITVEDDNIISCSIFKI